MPVSVEWQDRQSTLRLEGEININSASEVKGILLDCLASGKHLVWDLRSAEELDVTILQLLWAAQRDAARYGIALSAHLSAAVATTFQNAGFQPLQAGPD